MSNPNITRLVVGESIPLSMGVPVGQDLGQAEVSNTLRWRNGRWESNVGILDKVKQSLTNTSNVLQIPATKSAKTFKIANPKLIVGAAVGLIVCTALIYGALRYTRQASDAFAVVPDANTSAIDQKAAAVRTVDAPWIRPATEPTAAPGPDSGVPVVSGSLVGGQGTPAPDRIVVPVQTASPAQEAPKAVLPQDRKPVDVKSPEIKPANKKPGSPEAVILDMEPAAAVKAKEAPSVVINGTKSPVKDAPKRVIGAGLVAVTPDGKAALFTNPATRLPEKFGIGDKLPSGETVRSIDAKTGVVNTDTKEYRLE
jgi:hypothetical protein